MDPDSLNVIIYHFIRLVFPNLTQSMVPNELTPGHDHGQCNGWGVTQVALAVKSPLKPFIIFSI